MFKKTIVGLLLGALSTSTFAGLEQGMQAYEAREYEAAFQEFEPLAHSGSPEAQFRLGHLYDWGLGVDKNRKQAAIWYQKAAEQEHVGAQIQLGHLYLGGKGVIEDSEQAMFWYHKAAAQGSTGGYSSVAYVYEKGKGVPHDPTQAFIWYQKAAEAGDMDAQLKIGRMYSMGYGVARDNVQAEIWYRKAANTKDTYAQKALEEFLNCKDDTYLFGLSIKCTNRVTFQDAIKKFGGVAKREGGTYFSDIYDAKSLLTGASELFLTYTSNSEFAAAQYTFPSHMDTAQVVNIRNMVASKYGNHDLMNGSEELGEVWYQWTLNDGVRLTVSRGWPDTTTYLIYKYDDNYNKLMNTIERQKIESEAKKKGNQTNNF